MLSDLGTGFEDLLPHYDPTALYNAAVVATGQTADEMAYGPFIAVTSITWSNGVATVITATSHGFITGADVEIRGADQPEFNGRMAITVVDDGTFTFPVAYASATTATGTITCSNMIYYWRALGSQSPVGSLVQATASFNLASLTCPAAFTYTTVTSATTFTIASLTRSGTVATAVANNHGLTTGESVTISNARTSNGLTPYWNNTFVVTVVDANRFTFTVLSTLAQVINQPTGSADFSLLAVVTKNGHGLNTGDTVTITGGAPAAYLGTFAVTKLDANRFSYYMATSPYPTLPSGTFTCTPAKYLTATAIKANHGLPNGASVTIAGATPTTYNGTFTIVVLDANTFTYTLPSGAVSPATGTILCTTATGTYAKATVTQHGFNTGDYVTIAGAQQALFNGTFPVSVLDANTFTYTPATTPAGNATGIITATGPRVLAGQTPDSNPEAWQRAYNILPNADTALFINDLLLVPTAYEPASVDNYTTFSGGSYKKADYIVATNFLDYIHFTFSNEFRINAGSDDVIVDLCKFGQNAVIVLKTKSYAILSAVNGDLSQLSLDVRPGYGCAGPRAWAVSGSNLYFLSPRYGVLVLRQTDLGVMLGVNVPLTSPVQKTMDLIDWNQANTCRLTHWDNKLYLSAPFKTIGPGMLVYDFISSVRLGNNVWETGVMTQGWAGLDTGSALNVLEFHQLTLNGELRLFFLDTAGYVNLVEESEMGDQIAGTGPQGLAWEETQSYALTRAYDPTLNSPDRAVEETFSLATQRPNYSINVVFAGVANKLSVASNVTRDPTIYDRPFDAAAWNPTNVNNDFATPWRQDYSVFLPSNPIPAGATYDLTGGLYRYGIMVTPKIAHMFIPGPNESYLMVNGQELTAGAFISSVSSLTLYGNGNGTAVTAAIDGFLNLGGGIQLDLLQESLDTRRIGWRQGKHFQLEFINTQGRIRLAGVRLKSVPMRPQKGIVQ